MRSSKKLKSIVTIALSLFMLSGMTFTALAYLGDINLDGMVNSLDLKSIGQSLGAAGDTDPRWNPETDLNLDNSIDVADLAIAGRSYGSDRTFHLPRLLSNTPIAIVEISACLDGSDQLHITWVDQQDKAYYTRLDRFGNTLIDDVQLDSGGFIGNNGLAIACDNRGNTHIIWSGGGGYELYQARIDSYGFLVLPKSLIWNNIYPRPDIALDSQGRVHLVFQVYGGQHPIYGLISPDGTWQIWDYTLHVHEPTSSVLYPKIAVDSGDNIHLLLTELAGTDELYYARIGVGSTPSLPERVIKVFIDGTINVEPFIKLDKNRNAYVLWSTCCSVGAALYLEKIDPSSVSVVDDLQLFPAWATPPNTAAKSSLAIDSLSRVHLFSFTGWGGALKPGAYGVFSPMGLPVEPMRSVVYGGVPGEPQLNIDAQGEAQLVYRAYGPTGSGSPTCPDGQLCYQSTAFDSKSSDQTLPDLGIDNTHVSWSPTVARWDQPIDITATVFNAGWAASPATTATLDIQLSPDRLLGPPAQATVAIPALNPLQSFTFTTTLTLPYLPPTGYEKATFVRFLIQVDPDNTIQETTEVNNKINPPLVVMPLPTTAGLWTAIQDDTDTARVGMANYANTGTIHLTGPGISRDIPVTDYSTLVADDLPISGVETSYTLSWQAPGYRPTPGVEVKIKRNASDPYHIDYTPSNSPPLLTDRWGSLTGTVTDAATSNPLSNVTVRINGEGLPIQTTTNASGIFSPATKIELGKLIPGSYEVRLSKANFARVTTSVSISNLQQVSKSWMMSPTTKAYVHGNVLNNFGYYVVNADVNACGIHSATDEVGAFDMEVEASCTSLVVSKTGYSNLSTPMSLIPGLESLFPDLILEFNPPLTVVTGQDTVGSRIIDESTENLLPDEPEDSSSIIADMWSDFKDEFWPSFSIKIVYGGYHYVLGVGYSGSGIDRYLENLTLRLDPRTFEVHMLLAEIEYEGVTIPVPIVQDSGIRTAIYGLEA